MHIALWLEGTLQAYGATEGAYYCATEDFPTKSSIIGMMLKAMHRFDSQEELLARFTQGCHTVYRFVWQKNKQTVKPKLLQDFQIIGSSSTNRAKRVGGTDADGKIALKNYIQDIAAFGVIAEVPDDMCDEVCHALAEPYTTLWLGRACCIPTASIFLGKDSDPYNATLLFRDAIKNLEDEVNKPVYPNKTLTVRLDARRSDEYLPQGELSTIADVPISFGRDGGFIYRSQYTTRTVYTEYLDDSELN